MASVNKVTVHGNVRWQVRWRDADGRPCKKNYETAGEARAHRATVEHELAAGTYIDQRAGRVTFHEYAEAWRAAQPHRLNTARRVRSSLTQHVYPKIGDRPLVAIRMSELQALVGAMAQTLKPASTRMVFGTVAAIFAAAAKDRICAYDPSDGVKLPELDYARVTPLTVPEVDRLVEALPRRLQALALVAAQAGLRCGEVCGLQVRDVDFFRKTISVVRQSQPHGIGPLKNRSASRTVPIGEELVAVLAEHLAAFPAKGEEFIFRAADGRVMSDALLKQPWMHARRRAGLPGVGMHDLRHFYASVLIGARRSVKEVSERLGHANAAMTLNVYSHLWPKDDDGTRAAIDGAFREGRQERRRGA